MTEYFHDPTPLDLSAPATDDQPGFGLGETLVAIAPTLPPEFKNVKSMTMESMC